MADLTQTITNSFNLFGAGPPSLWGVMVWGEDPWGYSDDLGTDVTKVFNESLSLSDNYRMVFTIIFGNSLSVDIDTPEIEMFSGDYNYVFPGDKSNIVSQIVSDYTPASASDTSYTTVSIGSTIWT